MNKNSLGYIAIIFLLVTSSIFSVNLFFRQRTDYDLFDVRTLPHTIGDWKGRDLEITEREYKILETRNLISREYVNDAQEKIYLFIIYSETNRSVFHPPEVCLIGSGITINDKKPESMKLDKKEFVTNKLFLEKNNIKEIALYCYKTGNFYTDNYYLQQVYFALNQLFGKGEGGATIRVSMQAGKNEEIALDILKDFMKETIKTLEEKRGRGI